MAEAFDYARNSRLDLKPLIKDLRTVMTD